MRQVIIMSGISGSGKTTRIKEIAEDINRGKGVNHSVVSSDHYFELSSGYRFDPSKLSEAHAFCFREFILRLQLPKFEHNDLTFVDNTNTTSIEIAPYWAAAEAFGYKVEIRTIMCGNDDEVEKCYRRNKHGLSANAIYAQHQKLRQRQLAPWWENTVERVK